MCPKEEEIIKVVFGHSSNQNILRHLKECSTCLERYSEYKTLWNDMSQLQNITPPPINYDFIKYIKKKLITNTIFRYAIQTVFYLAVALPLLLYFYYNENNLNYKSFSIFQLLDNNSIKKYYNNTNMMLKNYYKENWFLGSINSVLVSHNNINKTYAQYLYPFIEKLNNLNKEDINDFTKNFTNLYELSIFSYFLSQELKINKMLHGQFDLKAKKLLDGILYYLTFSQNSDGGFGIQPSDQKSLPQTTFWISLFVRNYTILTNTIPYNVVNKIKTHTSSKTDIISIFVQYLLFNRDSSITGNPAEFSYVEQFLAYQFLVNRNKVLPKEQIAIFI